jgi:Flp pilus assembly protein TadD
MGDLGLALERRGDAAGAERLWLRAAQVDPRAAGPWLSLGNLYERRGDLGRARAAWRRFLELARYGVYPGQREAIAERLRALDAAGGAAGAGR